MTFKENDIVRLVSKDNDGEAMRVLDTSDTVAHVAAAKGERWLDMGDLEIVPDTNRVTVSMNLDQQIESELSSIGYSIDRIRDLMNGRI